MNFLNCIESLQLIIIVENGVEHLKSQVSIIKCLKRGSS